MELDKNLEQRLRNLQRRAEDFAQEDMMEALCELVEEFDGILYMGKPDEFARYIEPVSANDYHSDKTPFTYRERKIVAVISYPLDDIHVELFVQAEKLDGSREQEELPFCGDSKGGFHTDLIQFNVSKILDVILGYYYFPTE